MSNLKSFLKTQTSASVETLVKTTAKKMASSIETVLAAKIVATLIVLKGLGLDEEVRLFGLLILSRFAEKNLSVPAEVASLMPTTAPKPSATATPIKAVAPPALKPAAAIAKPPAPSVPGKPIQTAPARTLVNNTAAVFNTWLGYLRGIVAGKKDVILMKGVQNLTTRIFREGLKLTADNWTLFFSALMAAGKNGTHIIDRGANPSTIFMMAPVELVIDYIFGVDGFLVTVTGEIADCRGEMAAWMIAKANVALDAVEAIEANAGLSDAQADQVNNLINTIENAGGPKLLVEKGDRIMGNDNNDGTVYKDAVPANPPVKVAGLEKIGLALPASEPVAPPVKKASNKAKAAAKKAAKKTFSMSLGNASASPASEPVVVTAETAPAANTQPETESAPAATVVVAEPEPSAVPPAEVVEQVTTTVETTSTVQLSAPVDNGDKPEDPAVTKWLAEQLALEAEQATQPVNGKFVEPPPAEELANAATAGTTVH